MAQSTFAQAGINKTNTMMDQNLMNMMWANPNMTKMMMGEWRMMTPMNQSMMMGPTMIEGHHDNDGKSYFDGLVYDESWNDGYESWNDAVTKL